MATLVITQASERELKAQGIKAAQNIEWVKVVAASSTTSEGTTYVAKKIRSYIGTIAGGPFSVTVSTLTATITPVITLSGVYFIGLVGPITE